MKRSEFSENFYELIGAFVGDGFISCAGPHYILGFLGNLAQEKSYYESVIVPAMIEVFPNVTPKYRIREHCNSIEVRFLSKKLVRCFENWFGFVPGKKTETIKIPKWILQGDPNLLNYVIRGIFDTDGCVFFDERRRYVRPYPWIVICMKNSFLIEQLANVLSSDFTFYRQYRPQRAASYLEKYSHKNFLRWLNTIGFSNPRHLQKIESAFVA